MDGSSELLERTLREFYCIWLSKRHQANWSRNYCIRSKYQFMFGLSIDFFLFLLLSHICEVNYSYSFPSLLPIHNHILIYSTRPHYFSSNFYLVYLLLTPFPISLYYYFIYIFDYIVTVSSYNVSKLFNSILSHFSGYICYT